MKARLLGLSAAVLLPACAGPAPAPQAAPPQATPAADGEEVSVVLYRGLRVLPDSVNAIDWSKNSFGVSGNPPTLSLFDAMALPGIPCWLSVTVDVPPPVAPHSVGSLDIPNPPPGGANAAPWPVTFDNNPPGHWSIAKATPGGNSNHQTDNRTSE